MITVAKVDRFLTFAATCWSFFNFALSYKSGPVEKRQADKQYGKCVAVETVVANFFTLTCSFCSSAVVHFIQYSAALYWMSV